MRLGRLAVVVSLALVAAACGDDDDDGGGAATTTAAEAGAETTTTSEPVEEVELSYTLNPTVSQLSVEVGVRQGYAEELGLTVDRVAINTGPEIVAALVSGELDLAPFGPGNLYPLFDSGQDLVVIGTLFDRENFDIIVDKDFPLPNEDDGWEGVMRDLEGARIGVVARGAAAEDLARGLFIEAGLNPDSATYIATGLAATTLPAMQNGQIDAAIVIEPGVTLALQQGIAVQPFSIQEGTGPELMDWASIILTTTRANATEQADALCRFITMAEQGTAYIRDPANEDAMIDVMTDFLGVEPPVATAVLDRVRDFYPESVEIDPDRINPYFAFFHDIGKAQQAYDIADYTVDVCE